MGMMVDKGLVGRQQLGPGVGGWCVDCGGMRLQGGGGLPWAWGWRAEVWT